MNPVKEITEAALQQLLQDDATTVANIGEYFDVIFTSPMSYHYQLREDVKVIYPDESAERGMKELLLLIANTIARKKRNKKYYKTLEKEPHRIRIVSEGDSWFQHPLIKDIIDHLMDHYAVYSIGAGGDELKNMYHEEEFIRAIRQEKPQFLLLSAGGNDILGDRFKDFLQEDFELDQPGKNPGRFIKDNFYTELEVLTTYYQSIFEKLASEFPDLKILVHGYDYAIPGDDPNKGWIGKYLIANGIVLQEDKQALLRLILDAFNDLLSELCQQHPNARFIDLRNVVAPHQWKDEIHPDKMGFLLTSQKFKVLIEKEAIRESVA